MLYIYYLICYKVMNPGQTETLILKTDFRWSIEKAEECWEDKDQ